MKVPFYDSTREYSLRKDEFDSAVTKVMSRGDFILGPEVAEFEKESAAWLGARHAIGVASGSDALVLAADILGFRDGAEVLTPTFTFFASTSCVARLGGKPVLVDLDEECLEMDLVDAERRLTKATRGIIPVHLFLQPTPMEEIMVMARRHGLKVLEDAAEAWGMESRIGAVWKKAGTIGDIGIYSFFPTKTLGAYGDAGLVTTNDDELAKKIRSYRTHGSSAKYHHDYIGYNSRLDSIQAAILRLKLKTTDQAIAARALHGKHYDDRLSQIPGLRFPKVLDGSKSVYYVYNILVPRRDELARYLKERGIGWSIYYPIPLHLQKCFAYLGYKEGDFPVAERVSKEILALPMYPELRDDEVDYICDEIAAFYGKG
ncbi:MAG: DegT/DnrJ/EryC1/StrS family aminotransferase [Rectinemataceae bacterium]